MSNKIELEKEITVSYTIRIEVRKEGIYCDNTKSFQFIWGTSSNPVDIRDAHRENKGWFIKKEALEKRKEIMKQQIERNKEAIKILDQVLENEQ